MATLTLEIIKKTKPYSVAFLVRSGETRKRIPTGIRLGELPMS